MRKIGNKAVEASTGRLQKFGGKHVKSLFDFSTAPYTPEWYTFQAGQVCMFDVIPYVIEVPHDPDVVNADMSVGDIAASMSLAIHRLGPDNIPIACPKNFRKGCTCDSCAQEQAEWEKYRAANYVKKSDAAKEAAKIPKAFAAKITPIMWIRPYELRNKRWHALDQLKLVDMHAYYFMDPFWKLVAQKSTMCGGNSGDVLANYSVMATPIDSGFGGILDFGVDGTMSLETRVGPDITEEQEAQAFSISKYVRKTTNADIAALMFGGDEEPATGYEEPAEEARFNHQPKQDTNAPGPDHTDFSVDFGDDKPATPAPVKAEAPKAVNVGNLRFKDPCPVNATYMFGRHFDQKPECASCAHRDACENAE